MSKKKNKKQQRIMRLMARLNLLNQEHPTTQFQVKIWNQQRNNLIRQLAKYGIEMD